MNTALVDGTNLYVHIKKRYKKKRERKDKRKRLLEETGNKIPQEVCFYENHVNFFPQRNTFSFHWNKIYTINQATS